MASYYKNRQDLVHYINNCVGKAKEGEKFSISEISILYSVRYGFGRGTVMKVLQDYVDAGHIIISGDFFEVITDVSART